MGGKLVHQKYYLNFLMFQFGAKMFNKKLKWNCYTAFNPRGTVWRISLVVHVLMVGETGVPVANTCKHGENMQTLHRKSHNRAFWVLALITLLVGQFNTVKVIFSKWKSKYISMVNIGLNNMTVPNKTLDQTFAPVCCFSPLLTNIQT